MHQVPSDPSQATIVGDFDAFDPHELFEQFTDPALIVKWWPETAEIDLRVGGKYILCWPNQDWNLRGEYLAVEPGTHLAFTWSWDHEPRSEPQRVDLWFEKVHERGTRLGIFHGLFAATEEDQASRQGVVEGWIHFCMRLGGVAPGNVE